MRAWSLFSYFRVALRLVRDLMCGIRKRSLNTPEKRAVPISSHSWEEIANIDCLQKIVRSKSCLTFVYRSVLVPFLPAFLAESPKRSLVHQWRRDASRLCSS